MRPVVVLLPGTAPCAKSACITTSKQLAPALITIYQSKSLDHGIRTMTDGPVSLSCEQCKKRKIKCDKISPQCSACRLANISCHPVQRSRLPRGRTGKVKLKNNALADKIAKLENLVGRLETQIVERETASNPDNPGSTESTSDASRGTNRLEDLVARDFWTALSKEVVGLREALEGNDGDDDPQADRTHPQLQSGAQTTSDSLLFRHNADFAGSSDIHITLPMRLSLVKVYYDRVDVLFKVTHWPTVISMLPYSNQDNATSDTNLASIALKWCICFTAATTLSDQDCDELGLGPKTVLIDQCRAAAEASLAQSNFLIEPSFHSLQAFTIYLIGLRTSGHGALTWTLISLAIRLANAIDLGSETNNTLSALDIEQRRRLWFGIGLLDSQAAFGRGSTPMLSYTDLKHPPLNISDDETGIRTVSTYPSPDMFFTCLTHQGVICQRKICDPSIQDPQVRADIVASFESSMLNLHAHFGFSEIPVQRYAALLAKDMAVNLQLVLRRPPYRSVPFNLHTSQRSQSGSSTPPFNILDAATAVLERGLAKQHSTEFAKWSWFSWPRWYALAIVLVELGSTVPQLSKGVAIEQQHRARIDRAYNIAILSFKNYAQSATEVGAGTIWLPIAKLMRYVQKLYGDTTSLNIGTHADPNLTPPTGTTLPQTQNQSQHRLSERTVLARWHDALSDFNDTTTTQPAPETNPDFLWSAFLEDLHETSASGASTTATAGFNTISAQFPTQMQPSSNISEGAAESTWSLAPYIPIFPHLQPRYDQTEPQQNSQESQREQSRTQGQEQVQEQRSPDLPVRFTLMANGQEGRSVVGRVFGFM